MIWRFKPRNLSGEKFNYGMAVVFKKCYFIRLRETKEGQECASIGHFEIFSISLGEMQRKSRGTMKDQERYKRYSRGRAGAHERNNRGDRRCTAEVQEMNNRGTTEALHRTENT